MRRITISQIKVGDEVRWLQKSPKIAIVKKFSSCSEQWCKLTGKFMYYKDCEHVRVLLTTENCDYVLCCKDVEVVKKEEI
jgi:hypothetical protein